MPIGARLREERERLGLSQPKFAAIAGTTKQTLFSWESGKTAPDGFQIALLAEAAVDVLYVLTGQRSMGVTSELNPKTFSGLTPDEPPLVDQAATTGQVPPKPALSRREQALLANYRGSDEEGRRAMEATASALAHRDSAKPKRNSGE